MNRIILIFLFFISCFSAFSQDARKVSITFLPEMNREIIVLNKEIHIISSNEELNITKLKFYVSHLSFYKDEQLVWQDNELAHLMDVENDMSIKLTIKKDIDFNTIKFGLGIDSVTNVSGALDGDLDPLKGMYWTWQSGYVNFKMEGTSTAIRSESQRFEYHLGGYSAENNTYKTIDLTVGNSETINIAIDFYKFLSDFNVVTHLNVMSPGKVAVDLSKILASCFSIR
jgi:hypothetical protein